MFLRFVRLTTVEGATAREGFFTAAYELREKQGVDAASLNRLEDMLAWFRQNLTIPSRFNRSKSKGAYRRTNTKGLSWFKPNAMEHVTRAYELAEMLSQHGYYIEVLKSPRPGYVVFEDEFQLIAEPFADTAGA